MLETLTRGAQGAAVAAVQRNLKDIGVPVEVDGDFGPKTAQALTTVKAKSRKVQRRVRKKIRKTGQDVMTATVEAVEEVAEEARAAKRQIVGTVVEGVAAAGSLAAVAMLLPELQGGIDGLKVALEKGEHLDLVVPIGGILIILARVWQRVRAAGIF